MCGRPGSEISGLEIRGPAAAGPPGSIGMAIGSGERLAGAGASWPAHFVLAMYDRSCYCLFMANATSTRERILDQGIALMSQSGLEGVTLGVLAERVGMSKSGLFAHFRSKEEVQIGLLEHTSVVGAAHIIAPSMQKPEGLPRLKALVSNWFGWAPRAGLPGGCPVAAGLFEFDDVEGPVRDKILEMEAEWRGLLTQTVREAMSLGHLRPDLDAVQFVWELCGIYLSHHAAQRFLKSPDADRRAAFAFESLLARSLPARSLQVAKRRKIKSPGG
jgi:AcrR family transcriptional regulator